MIRQRPPRKITRERVERALRICARLVAAKGGEALIPLFEQLERDLDTVTRQQDTRARALALLEQEERRP